MRIAVTGGSGRIGVSVCSELLDAGLDITCLDKAPPEMEVPFTQVDLCSLDEALQATAGFEQVVHLAAIPDPSSDPAERVMGVNMQTAFNVFEAARQNGVTRVVYGCSESSTGFGIHKVPLVPLYVPIDEQHPCWPHETYSLSKHFGELIGQDYARAYGLEVVSLRYAWVWMHVTEHLWRPIVTDAQQGLCRKPQWFGAHITVKDVARACLAAVKCPLAVSPPCEAFMLTARDTFHPVPTLEVLQTIYGKLPEVRDPAYFEANPYASVFDIRKAERLLDWKPLHDWRAWETWDLT